MQAVTYNFENNQFSLAKAAIPALAPDEVLVKVQACGLNPVDAKISQWQGLISQKQQPWIGGLDIAGEIKELGSAVTGWEPGAKVLYHGNMLQPYGGFAEYAVAKAAILLPQPALSAVAAAALPCSGWTAWRGLHDKLRITAADSLLIMGASGGVGSYAVQVARAAGLNTIIAVCSQAKHDWVKSLGATHTLDYRQTDLVDAVLAITQGVGVSRALDAAGNGADKIAADCLAFEGELLELVTVCEPAQYQQAFLRSLSFHQFSLGSAVRSGPEGLVRHLQAAAAFNACVEQGQIQPIVTQVITMQEVPAALAQILAGHTQGKIIMQL